MMRCRDVHDLASAYLDAELDDARASALRGHLRVCPACMSRVRDMAAVRDTMAELEPVDPPPSLWAAVERGLAEAEIADAGRSRLWLRWQQVRPRLLPAAVAMAAVTAATLWLIRSPAFAPAPTTTAGASAGARTAAVRARTAAVRPTTASAAMPMPTPHAAEEGALAPYEATLAELRQIVAAERTRWPAEASARFDRRMATFRDQAEPHRLAQGSTDPTHPSGRDPHEDALLAVYRAEIDFLQNAAVYGVDSIDGGDAMEAAHERGPNGEGRP